MASAPEAKIFAVIRVPDVSRIRSDVETLLGVSFDRFEPSRRGAGSYAQFNVKGGDIWESLVRLLEQVGPPLQDCLASGDIGTPEVDVGWPIGTDIVAASLRIPRAVTSAVALLGFELVVSAYSTE